MKMETQQSKIQDIIKVVLRGKFTVIQASLREYEKSQINNLILHLKELGKEKTKTKKRRRKENIEIRLEINEIETKRKIRTEKINKNMSWFSEKKDQVNKIRNETSYKSHHGNTRTGKRLLPAIICQ